MKWRKNIVRKEKEKTWKEEEDMSFESMTKNQEWRKNGREGKGCNSSMAPNLS